MDFTSRNLQSSSAHAGGPASSAPNQTAQNNKKDKSRRRPGWLNVAGVVLLFGVTILVVALLCLLYIGKNGSEEGYVNTSKYQAVFLTNGQVYFGKINKDSNAKYIDISDIFYLQVNQTVQPNQSSSTTNTGSNNVSLVKLGCELHGPYDQMLINRDQVTFWENLKSDGQVAKAISQYKQANPNPSCNTNSSSTNQAPSSNTSTGTNSTSNSSTSNSSGSNKSSTSNNP